MGRQTLLTKTLTTSSSGYLGSFSSAATTLYTSGATATVATSSGATATFFDSQRRITLWSTAADQSSLLVTLTGLSDAGNVIKDTITGSTAANTITRFSNLDFGAVTNVSFSSTPIEGALHFGVSSRGSTPWVTTNTWADPFSLAVTITMSATNNSMLANFECTLDDITQIGTQNPKFLSSTPTTTVPFYPTPFIPQIAGSTFISSIGDAVALGNLTSPVAAWRITLTSSSSTAGTMNAIGLQAG